MKDHAAGRRPYPSDVSDAEWAFVAPHLTLMDPEAPQREHSLRDLFNALRWIVRSGAPWRYMPSDFPPWAAVHQQMRRWMAARVFEQRVHDLRALLRICEDRSPDPTAVIFDGRVMPSTPESSGRAGYDGHKRKTTRRNTAFISKWSGCPRRSGGLCCCQGGGWWSGALRGCRDSVGWRGTMNGSRRRWPGFTSWPSRR